MTVQMVSESNSHDLAILACSDLTDCAQKADIDYRIVGGVMSAMYRSGNPTLITRTRMTSDVDIGIHCQAVTADQLDHQLRACGYVKVDGNRYVQNASIGQKTIDVLVTQEEHKRHNIGVGAITADAVEGLHLALARPGVHATIEAALHSEEKTVTFTAAFPDLGSAIVIKAAAWAARHSWKDAVDVIDLVRIFTAHQRTINDLPGRHSSRQKTQKTLRQLARNSTKQLTAAECTLLAAFAQPTDTHITRGH